MQTVILCGGLGARLREETEFKPKPMVAIGPRPILWHIMSHYRVHGVRDFILCLGYRGEVIRDYFLNFHHHNVDVRVDLSDGTVTMLGEDKLDWRVTLVETAAAREFPDDENLALEAQVLENLAARNQLAVFKHTGFWQCMDTFREMQLLNDMWVSGAAAWKTW